MESKMETEFDALLAKLVANAPSDDELRRREREQVTLRVNEWRQELTANLPNWPFARWDNAEWRNACDITVASRLRAWQPFERQGRNFVAGKGTLVCGGPRTGKSTGVYAAIRKAVKEIREAADKGEPIGRLPRVQWTTEAQLVVEQRQFRSELFGRCARADVLVIDEVGLAGGHAAPTGQSPVIMHMLCERYDRGLTTVITSGIGTKSLLERYGAGALRRMTERAVVVDLLEPMRLQ